MMLTQEFSICLISCFNLYELFPVFIYNDIASLANSLFGVIIVNPFPFFISSSPLFSGGMSDKSSSFSSCLLNFTLSGIVSSGSDLLYSSSFLCH